jgi:rhodanese-related sulfurtransferase
MPQRQDQAWPSKGAENINVYQLDERRQRPDPPVLLDVRESDEFALCHIDGALSMPLLDVPARYRELDPAQDIVVCCHTGNKSLEVVRFLRRQGFRQVSNLEGGIDVWALAIDHSFPIYGRDAEKSNALKQAFWEKVKKFG